MNDAHSVRLILVRHGNTFEAGQTPLQVGARSDLVLTEQGRKQARHFANYLVSAQITPSAIYAGALKRQIETAQIVGNSLHLENKIHLRETALTEIDYGPWEGLSVDEIKESWPHEYEAWTTRAEWPVFFGSPQEELLHDIKTWINRLQQDYQPGETVIGVTSNGVIRFFYALQSSADWKNLIQTSHMEDLKVKTGHFCELSLFKNQVKVEGWNRDPSVGL